MRSLMNQGKRTNALMSQSRCVFKAENINIVKNGRVVLLAMFRGVVVRNVLGLVLVLCSVVYLYSYFMCVSAPSSVDDFFTL